MVEPSYVERTLIKHSEYLTDATIITSQATNTAHGRTFHMIILRAASEPNVRRATRCSVRLKLVCDRLTN
ncbi:hypothetical protein IEQ34_005670 [Dendrobium chrysotoxum]|uniref:Uncharacterized protein n=1 Tax=Dendrobium chrysotoxum TaxID=161865 RepID=A0AAV7H9B5_DENCH|nr:hypothetical protein IEQ34_005670 [Dendrobium chrysotoxum]